MMPRWLKLKDAQAYSAIGRDRLKRLATEGEIVGFRDDTDRRDWIFCRVSLDQYRENQAGAIEVKAAEIFKTM